MGGFSIRLKIEKSSSIFPNSLAAPPFHLLFSFSFCNINDLINNEDCLWQYMNPAYFDSIFRHDKLVSWVSCRLIKWLRSRARILANISIVKGEEEKRKKKTGERKPGRPPKYLLPPLRLYYYVRYDPIFYGPLLCHDENFFFSLPTFCGKKKNPAVVDLVRRFYWNGLEMLGILSRAGDGDVWRDDGGARTHTHKDDSR